MCNAMAFRLNVHNGKIHSIQGICPWGSKLKESDYIDYSTIHEARARAKERNLVPCLCKRCRYREDLQKKLTPDKIGGDL